MADAIHVLNATATITHNYYPPTIQLPHYVANDGTVPSLIARFGALWATLVGGAFATIYYVRPRASRSDQIAFIWMCFTGFIHFFFEAYFVVNHKTLAGSRELFGQLWKEYSFSDSRYLTSDAFVVCMEAITAFCWGPLSFIIAYCIATQHPARHPLQLIVSLGQIYGDILYYGTSLFDISYCRPEKYYFWFYYVFFNFIWVVVPFYYMRQSFVEIVRAFRKPGEQPSVATKKS